MKLITNKKTTWQFKHTILANYREKGNFKTNFRIFQKITTIKILHSRICDWVEQHSPKNTKMKCLWWISCISSKNKLFCTIGKRRNKSIFYFMKQELIPTFNKNFQKNLISQSLL